MESSEWWLLVSSVQSRPSCREHRSHDPQVQTDRQTDGPSPPTIYHREISLETSQLDITHDNILDLPGILNKYQALRNYDFFPEHQRNSQFTILLEPEPP